MADALIITAGLGLGIIIFISIAFFISSLIEYEKRAASVSALLTAVLLAVAVVFIMLAMRGVFDAGLGLWVLAAAVVLGLGAATLLVVPLGANPDALRGTAGLIVGEVTPADERDTVFSQQKEERALQAMAAMGENVAKEEQHGNPGETAGCECRRVPDEFINALEPQQLSGSSIPDKGVIDGSGGRIVSAMTDACSQAALQLNTKAWQEPEPAAARMELTAEEATQRVKGFARHIGAALVGVTEIGSLWRYSSRGTSGLDRQKWGADVPDDHRYAVVFAVEMDLDMVSTGPHTPTVMETMHNYARVAFIAGQIAAFISNLGYSARANQMERYDALMVPLAVDAGLGELSRMGYLITREYGPRVRLNIVTTDLPLVADKPVDIGVVDFCRVCEKCAHCCPSQSIPTGDRRVHNGLLRWKLHAESCLKYWRSIGTDCAVCMRVCPWSHARIFPHTLIVALIVRNALARRLFNRMDDLFYGTRPPRKTPPQWARCERMRTAR